jgi:hypothetical protein
MFSRLSQIRKLSGAAGVLRPAVLMLGILGLGACTSTVPSDHAYFKPGFSAAAYASDASHCADYATRAASRTTKGHNQLSLNPISSAFWIVGGIAHGAVKAAEDRAASYSRCMQSGGYAGYRLTQHDQAYLARATSGQERAILMYGLAQKYLTQFGLRNSANGQRTVNIGTAR